MPSINFKPRFAEPVKSGQKRQTIRPHGKRAWKVGDMAYFFTGLRGHGTATRLGQARLLSVRQVLIDTEGREVHLETPDGRGGSFLACLLPDRALAFAQADGFATLDDFFRFFREQYGGGISGYLLEW
ncbi:MAG: hypothetical protein LBE62_02325 [Azonexus sp.]|jgi:hypothetical protein|nr:hypothetical protein [Azonexus sp.]